jgi:hypothetical protein
MREQFDGHRSLRPFCQAAIPNGPKSGEISADLNDPRKAPALVVFSAFGCMHEALALLEAFGPFLGGPTGGGRFAGWARASMADESAIDSSTTV